MLVPWRKQFLFFTLVRNSYVISGHRCVANIEILPTAGSDLEGSGALDVIESAHIRTLIVCYSLIFWIYAHMTAGCERDDTYIVQ